MPLKTSQSEELPAVNLTSMIDVVFLLIIFFMVGTRFTDTQQQIGIKLPGVGGLQAQVAPPDRREVSVSRDGVVALDAIPITTDELTRRLLSMRVQYPRLSVVVSGDGTAPYQKVAEAISAVNRAGVVDLSIAMRTQGAVQR